MKRKKITNGALILFLTVLMLAYPIVLALDGSGSETTGYCDEGETLFIDYVTVVGDPDLTYEETAPYELWPYSQHSTAEAPEEIYDSVHDYYELQEWLAENQAAGGTVTLGDNITITDDYSVLNANAPITIATGPFGIVLDGGRIIFEGEAHFIGEGVDAPVLEARDLGPQMQENWSHALREYSITATGRDSAGGVALMVSSTGGDSFDALGAQESRPIRSYGEGAVGMKLTAPFSAYCLDISAYGPGSAAVSAPEGALLSFCKLSARGEGAAAVIGNDVVLDTCILTPELTDADIRTYNRGLAPDYLPVKLGSYTSQDLAYDMENTRAIAMLHGSSGGSAITGIPVVWDKDAWGGIDLDAAGLTEVPGAFAYTDQPTGDLQSTWFNDFLPLIAPDEGPLIVVDVRCPDVPCIYDVQFSEGAVTLRMWETDAWTTDDCILWHSLDGGESWDDCIDAIGAAWGENSVELPAGSVTEGSLFYVEAPDAGYSNIVLFSMVGDWLTADRGGDRLGLERPGGSADEDTEGGRTTRNRQVSASTVTPTEEEGLPDDPDAREETDITDDALPLADEPQPGVTPGTTEADATGEAADTGAADTEAANIRAPADQDEAETMQEQAHIAAEAASDAVAYMDQAHAQILAEEETQEAPMEAPPAAPETYAPRFQGPDAPPTDPATIGLTAIFWIAGAACVMLITGFIVLGVRTRKGQNGKIA